VRLDVPVPGLLPALDSFTIAHISDLHVGPGAWLPVRARGAADIIQSERPDVVVDTGDFMQAVPPIEAVRETVRPFLLETEAETKGPGNVAVLGNHDYYAGDEAVAELKTMLAALGVCVLANETVTICRRGTAVAFTGLDETEPGFQEALERMRKAPRPHIVLVHDAHLAERLPADTADLILAGHTHGGQITLPGLTGLVVRRFNGSSYIQGWYRINGNRVYINRGLGCTGLPLRFRARPEVTLIRLRH
jgi:predicted MPP superfamily phosphohydrolase